jgi:hypothetical protein
MTELAPDLVLVHTWLHTRGRGSGLEADADVGQIWEFQDEKAVRMTMYRRFEDAREAGEELAKA